MSRGPVQYFVLTFPGIQFKGEIVPALAQVAAHGSIRSVDIVFAKKEMDGITRVLEITNLNDDEFNISKFSGRFLRKGK